MQRRRVRFTIRRMMTVVLVIAIILGIGGMLHRWHWYRKIAEYHRIEAEKAAARQKIAIWKATTDERFGERAGAMRNRLLADWIGRVGSFHTDVGWKYSRAAWRPWQFAGPDPPRPPRPREL
jgi:hypothetical protein